MTVNTWEKKALLAGDREHDTLIQAWRLATAWHVGRYVMMPTHVHFFCEPQYGHDFDLWIRYWKRLTSQNWPFALPTKLWEYDCWDTQMRSAGQYNEKWAYVLENPVRAGLVKDADDWPFAGEVHQLSW